MSRRTQPPKLSIADFVLRDQNDLAKRLVFDDLVMGRRRVGKRNRFADDGTEKAAAQAIIDRVRVSRRARLLRTN